MPNDTPATANSGAEPETRNTDSLKVSAHPRRYPEGTGGRKFRRREVWFTPEDDTRLDRIVSRYSYLLGRPVASMVVIRRALALLDENLKDLRSAAKKDRELAALFKVVAPR